MLRRLKSLERSRRTPVLARRGPDRPFTTSPIAVGRDTATAHDPELSDPPANHGPAAPPANRSVALPTPEPPTPLTVPFPASPAAFREQPLPPPASSHAPTGWDWFAQWPFPTQLFLFSLVTAAGMWWFDRPATTAADVPDPPAAVRPAERPRARIRPETFDWLNRLRETQVVNDQLEADFAEAQAFYREYALDEFLDFDPWSLGSDEVFTLTHFCDQGFFTVEREILVKILERKAIDRPAPEDTGGRGAAARLASAVRDRESRLASLREASEMYHRGRAAEVTLPGTLTPEEDQAQRARLVDKLAAVRRERARLEARIAELSALLR